jgi:flagellar basal-body rod modification protein FlgD
MTVASVATQQAAVTNSGTASSTGALGALSSNMNTFLNLLMTQLQNQDPTSPLDSSQFTSQLVQYSSVEQQITTNTNLTSLIQLTQGNEVVQSAAMLGKQAQVASDHLSLQNGVATVDFNATLAGPASIVVTNSLGQQVATATVNAGQGANTWTWDGASSGGNTEPDGAYQVTVLQTDATGATVTVPTTIVGTVTGVTSTGSAVTVDMGALSVDFSALRSMQQ